MAPRKVTINDRVGELKNECLYVFDTSKKIMMCQCCNVRVEWLKKSTVENHCSSESHKSAKLKFRLEEDKKKQINIKESIDIASKTKADKDEFVMSTVRAFVSANIPLEKFEQVNFRNWMKKYIKGSGDLPSVDHIRKHIIPKIKAEDDSAWKEALIGRDIVILCDESTDRRGRAVFIVLFKILPDEGAPAKLFVAGVTALSAANAQEASRNVVQVLNKFEVNYERVKGMVSDSAPYMTACFNTLRGIIGEHFVHIQCWAHKMDKLEKIPPDIFKRLNEFVKKTKKVFKNTRKRRNRYKSFLETKYKDDRTKSPRLFPMPVMSRWNSWKKASDYVEEYADDLVQYIKTLPDEISAIRYFKNLSEEDVAIVKAEAAFVKEHCSNISDLLLKLEGSKLPFAHQLYFELNLLLTSFKLIEDSSDMSSVLGEKTRAAFSFLHRTKKQNLTDRFKRVAKACRERLSRLIDSDPARNFFEHVGSLFHPLKMMSTTPEKITKSLTELSLFKEIPINELQVLYGVLKENVRAKLVGPSCSNVSNVNVVLDVVTGMSATNKNFAFKCLKLINFPVSNGDCERAFSGYGDIVSPKRSSMLVHNAEIHLNLYFSDDIDYDNDFDNSMDVDVGI